MFPLIRLLLMSSANLSLLTGRRQATEDMWIFTVQDQSSPQIRYGDTPSNRSRPMVPGELNKPISDALPSYEEAIKLPPIFPKDTVQHV